MKIFFAVLSHWAKWELLIINQVQKDTACVVFQVARSQSLIFPVMMWTAGSLEKRNKANWDANLTHYVNLGLAEMRASESAFFFSSDNFSFILEYALLVIGNLWMSYPRPEHKLWISLFLTFPLTLGKTSIAFLQLL